MILGKDAKRALVKAMGLEVEGCTEAELDIPMDDCCSVHLTYHLRPEWLERMGQILAEDEASKKEAHSQGGPVDPNKSYTV